MKSFSKYSKRGLPGGPNEIIEYMTGSVSTDGFKFDSEDVDNDFNIIPSGDITMEDVEFPVFGIDNLGNSQMMMPEENYEFPGDMVFELPMAQKGLEKYQTLGGKQENNYMSLSPSSSYDFPLRSSYSTEPQLKSSTGYIFPYEKYEMDASTQFGEYRNVKTADNFTKYVAGEIVEMPIDRDEFGNVDYTTQYNELPTVVVKPEGSFVQYRVPTNRALLNKNKEYQDQQLYVEDDSIQSQRDRLSNFISNNPNLTDKQKRIAQNKVNRGRYLQYDKIFGGADAWTDTERSGAFMGDGPDLENQERVEDPNYYSSIADFRETIGKPFTAGLAMTPLVIAGGPAALNFGRGALNTIATVLNTPLVSSAPYITAGNALNTYFGGDFLFNRAPKIPGLIADEEYGQAAKEGFFGGLDILGLGAVAKSKRAYDLSRNLVNTVDDIEDVVRTTGTGFPGYNQTYNKADFKGTLDDLFDFKRSSPQNPRVQVNTGATTDLAKAQEDYFRSQGIFPRNTALGAEDLTMYQQTDSYRDINAALGRYVETGEITPELAGIISRNRNYSSKAIGGRPTSNLTTQRIGNDEYTLVARGDEVVPSLMSDLKPGDRIIDLKPTSVSDINAPGFQALGSNYQGPVTQITNVPAGSNVYNPSMQANQGMVRSMDIGDSELLLPVGSVRRFKGTDESGNFLFDLIGDYKDFKVGGNKSLPMDDSMLSTQFGKTLVKDDRYRDVRKKLGGGVMKRLAKILDEN